MNDNLKTSANGLEHITKWEGLMLKRYICPAGKPTIGVGHVILPGEDYQVITKEQALEILAKDVERFEKAVKTYITVELNQNQFDALVSFVFNTGEGGIKNTGVQKTINAGKFSEVPQKLAEWSKFRVNGILKTNQGLLNRRKSEATLFMKPVEKDFPIKDYEELLIWNNSNLKEAQSYLKTLCLYDKHIDGLWGPGTFSGLTLFAEKYCLFLGNNPKEKIPKRVFELLKLQAAGNC